MRFKIDKNLNRVAAAKEARPETVAVELYARYVESGLIENPNNHSGESVLIATGRQTVKNVCEILAEYLYGDEYHTIPSDVFDSFCELTIV